MSRKTLYPLTILILLGAALAGAESSFERGEDLFLRNKPQEAIPLLEEALEAEPRNGTIYMYLGVAYEQVGRRNKAVEILRRGVETAREERDRMFLTMGNNLRFIEQYEDAEQSYGEAVSENSLYAPAYLARANLRVEMEKFEPAVEDYEIFLELRPESEHRPEIEQMIALLRDKVDEKARRAAEEAEQRKREEELARREAERRREEEQARQQALLDNVLNSLQGASEETQNLPGGSEDIQELEEDFDIVE
ncbi:MAG: tetratricopeptide repeat protein [Spirochaetaceae bacterium]